MSQQVDLEEFSGSDSQVLTHDQFLESFPARSDRIIIVGDVHGCLEELILLLKSCGYDPSEPNPPRVILVGDLVGKGPLSREVIDFVKSSPRMESVIGNHDEYVLFYHSLLKKKETKYLQTQKVESVPSDVKLKLAREVQETMKMKEEYFEICQTFEDEHYEYLRSFPFYLTLKEKDIGIKGGIIVVHAGFIPGIPLKQQDSFTMTKIRSLTADGKPLESKEGTPWVTKWKGPELVIFGHDAVAGLQLTQKAIGLDTGCCYGNKLSAFVLPERVVVQLQATKMHSFPKHLAQHQQPVVKEERGDFPKDLSLVS